MDILLNVDSSLYWQIPLGLLLTVLSVVFIWLAFRIGKTLKSVEALLDENVFNLLKAIEELVDIHKAVSAVASSLFRSVDRAIITLNRELPQLLEATKRIAASIGQISESEIRPTMQNIQEITETVNQNVAKIDAVVDSTKDFSQTTIKQAEYYRDQVFGPVTNFISGWSALKAGWKVLNQSRKSDPPHSEGETLTEPNR